MALLEMEVRQFKCSSNVQTREGMQASIAAFVKQLAWLLFLMHLTDFRVMQGGLFATCLIIMQIDGRRLDSIAGPMRLGALHNYHSDARVLHLQKPEESERDDFNIDLYAIPEVIPTQPCNNDLVVESGIDEENKIKALVETPALDWSCQGQDGYSGGRGFDRGMGRRTMDARAFEIYYWLEGRDGFESKAPPVGYICHRCKVPGHFIQHCPTNGYPNYDIRRAKPPAGIPKSMLIATINGSYELPSGAVAVLKPNEDAFEKEIEGIPSTRPVGVRCQLCKEAMKDAL